MIDYCFNSCSLLMFYFFFVLLPVLFDAVLSIVFIFFCCCCSVNVIHLQLPHAFLNRLLLLPAPFTPPLMLELLFARADSKALCCSARSIAQKDDDNNDKTIWI